MATTTLGNIRYPVSGDAPNLAQFFQNLAEDTARQINPGFPTVAARNAAYDAFVAAGGAMVRGMRCRVGTVEHTYGGNGPGHVPAAWIEPTWKTYTPTWGATGAGTQPSVGNGTLTGQYRVFDDNAVHVVIYLLQGSTSDGGSGAAGQYPYFFTLPTGLPNTSMPASCKGHYKTSADAGGLFGLLVPNADRITPITAAQNNAVIGKGLLDAPGSAFIQLEGLYRTA